eukprot:gnl/Chilomastix_cuspidata/1207.p1 GENE.gnl/Chilomastix_cuspidata/1207~~gnl/Chilomastix_cuspidata/1207.p1  ORF type:complete len:906 (-),score=339.13 gnl/Chilomastix_cuspidata/1207:88-2805(-)
MLLFRKDKTFLRYGLLEPCFAHMRALVQPRHPPRRVRAAQDCEPRRSARVHLFCISARTKKHSLPLPKALCGSRMRETVWWKSKLLWIIVIIVVVALVVGLSVGFTVGNDDQNLISVEDATLETISPQSLSSVWITDSLIAFDDNENLYSLSFPDGEKTLLTPMDLEIDGASHAIKSYTFSSDGNALLVAVDAESRWRHSYTAAYYLLDLTSPGSSPVALLADGSRPIKAIFVDRGGDAAYSVAVVIDNVISVVDVFSSGAGLAVEEPVYVYGSTLPNVYVGEPDWLYEEEVFSSDTAIAAAAAPLIAFTWIDDTGTPLNNYTMFPTDPSDQYPWEESLPYAKPGEDIPVVSLFVSDISGAEAATYSVSMDLAVLGDTRGFYLYSFAFADADLIIRLTNRQQTVESLQRCSLSGGAYECAQFYLQTAQTGWVPRLERSAGCFLRTPVTAGGATYDYVDILLPEDQGASAGPVFPVAALLNTQQSPSAAFPVFQSASAQAYSIVACSDSDVTLVTTTPSPQHRQITTAPLDGSLLSGAALNSPGAEGYYDVLSVSPSGSSLIVSFSTPTDIPIVYAVPADTVDADAAGALVITANEDMQAALDALDCPTKRLITLEDGIPCSAGTAGFDLESYTDDSGALVSRVSAPAGAPHQFGYMLTPPGFNEKKKHKYPFLLQIYGGPDSQKADAEFPDVDWLFYLASHGVVVLTLDGAGTGYRGHDFAAQVYGNLGERESLDYVEALAHICSSDAWDFLDCDRFGVYGWSYGGYSTGFTVAQAGKNGTLAVPTAVSVAPVTDWRLYDATYTERYMNTPQDNPEGYEASSLLAFSAHIAQATAYMLAHGTGDDNVNFLNSALLITRLVEGGLLFDSFFYPNMAHHPEGDAYTSHIYKNIMRHLNETFGCLPAF